MFRVFLASQSPRRAQLLAQIGVEHTLLVPGADEDAEALEAVFPGEEPLDYVRRVTRLKWEAAQQRRQRLGLPDDPVLCADTTVALGSLILGKPADADDAARMLRLLSGHVHEVLTAVALGTAKTGCRLRVNTSRVRFVDISDAAIAAYVASGEPLGKAGAYAIQGRAAVWVDHIEGSFSGIMGLPVHEVAQLLKPYGYGC